MKANRGETRVTDLNFLPPAGHTTGLTASVLWTFPLTSLDPWRRGDDMDRTLGLIVGAVVAQGGISGCRLTREDEGGGISERVKWEGERKTLTRTWR